MGTVIEFWGIKIKVNANDHSPPHCHIEGKGCAARYNLIAMSFTESTGFSKRDLANIEERIKRNHDVLMQEWSKFHGEE